MRGPLARVVPIVALLLVLAPALGAENGTSTAPSVVPLTATQLAAATRYTVSSVTDGVTVALVAGEKQITVRMIAVDP